MAYEIASESIALGKRHLEGPCGMRGESDCSPIPIVVTGGSEVSRKGLGVEDYLAAGGLPKLPLKQVASLCK